MLTTGCRTTQHQKVTDIYWDAGVDLSVYSGVFLNIEFINVLNIYIIVTAVLNEAFSDINSNIKQFCFLTRRFLSVFCQRQL